MSIAIVQTCNGCGQSRTIAPLDFEYKALTEKNRGGWRQVEHNVHLCNICIRNAVKK